MQPLTTAVWDFPHSEEDEKVKEFKAGAPLVAYRLLQMGVYEDKGPPNIHPQI